MYNKLCQQSTKKWLRTNNFLVLKYGIEIYQLGLNMTKTWSKKKQAGSDWLGLFTKRHTNLSLRTPEKTFLSRATSFNKHNIQTFFKNYSLVLKRQDLLQKAYGT